MGTSRLLHVIKTPALVSDGRLLKWIATLSDEGIRSEVFILEDKNDQGPVVHAGTEVTRTRLLARKVFPQRSGYFLKVPEYTLRTLYFALNNRSDVIIFHDMQHYLALFVLCVLKPSSRIVWDMHELPHGVMLRNPMTRGILKFILQRVDLLIYTNDDRRAYLRSVIDYEERDFSILNNWPTDEYVNADRARLAPELIEWLSGRPYVLWMGAANEARNFPTVLNALLPYKDRIKLVILGPVGRTLADTVNKGKSSGFIYQDFVPQEELIRFIDNAAFAVVLYKNTSMNNWLCEPNRLYQLTSRGIPVIVGNNPPMKRFMQLGWPGVLLADDGSDERMMKHAIAEMLNRHGKHWFAPQNKEMQAQHTWAAQTGEIVDKISLLLQRSGSPGGDVDIPGDARGTNT